MCQSAAFDCIEGIGNMYYAFHSCCTTSIASIPYATMKSSMIHQQVSVSMECLIKNLSPAAHLPEAIGEEARIEWLKSAGHVHDKSFHDTQYMEFF